jgi:hypothetical protein
MRVAPAVVLAIAGTAACVLVALVWQACGGDTAADDSTDAGSVTRDGGADSATGERGEADASVQGDGGGGGRMDVSHDAGTAWAESDAADCPLPAPGWIDGTECDLPGEVCVVRLMCGPRCVCRADSGRWYCEDQECALLCPAQRPIEDWYWCISIAQLTIGCVYTEGCVEYGCSCVHHGLGWECEVIGDVCD